jgi:hypothetical protein
MFALDPNVIYSKPNACTSPKVQVENNTNSYRRRDDRTPGAPMKRVS